LAGIARLKERGGQGCILVGNPGYYKHFGFEVAPSLCPPGLPAQYFMVACFGERPTGTFAFHPAFFGDAAA
jgi:putative acetyltransferase